MSQIFSLAYFDQKARMVVAAKTAPEARTIAPSITMTVIDEDQALEPTEVVVAEANIL